VTPAPLLAGAGLVVVTVALAAGAARVEVLTDEAWFLQVITRVRWGDLLYRDVFYGAGPLPIWIGSLVARRGSRRLVGLRVLGVGYFVGLMVAGSWVLAQADAGPRYVAAFWIASLAFAPPTSALESHYTRLALLAAVVAAGVMLPLGPSSAAAGFALAGAAAGVAFSSKQTVGVVSALASVAAAANAAGVRGAAWCAAGVLAVAGGGLVPLARAGALGWYVRRCFLNKTSYLATGTVGIRHGVIGAMDRPFRNRVHRDAYRIVMLAAYAVVIAAMVLVLPAVWLRLVGDGGAGRADVTVASLGLVVLSAVVPRADFSHIRGLFPVALLTVALALSSHAPDSVPAGVVVAAAVVGGGLTLLALAISVRRFQVSRSGDAWLEGLPVTIEGVAGAGALRERTGGEVFLLRPDASLWYLSGGLTNPTPYDYPYASVFGPHGQQDVIAGIRAGRIAWVCWPGPTWGPLQPKELEEFVAASMVAVGDSPAGVLYRVPDGPEAARS